VIVPSPVIQIVEVASATYKVPSDILYAIWVKESGGNYPNVAVNSAGYGGLFGTKLWNGPPQDQANLAASILAYLRGAFGSWDAAIHEYSSGTTTGGYSLADLNVIIGELILSLDANDPIVAEIRTNINEILSFVNGAHLNGPSLDELLTTVKTEVEKIVPTVPAGVDLTPVLSAISKLQTAVDALSKHLGEGTP
jgi:hypothetical protein